MTGSGDLFEAAASSRLRATAPLATRLRPRRLDDVLGEGPWLITGRPAPATLGIASHGLDEPALAPFLTDLIRWFDAHNADAVLVRPDRYVFGTGGPTALASAWATSLQPQRQTTPSPA